MKPTPPGWPRFSPSLHYADAAAAIDWLCDAFGFEVRLKVEGDGGRIEHSELEYGGGIVMVSSEKPEKFSFAKAPSSVGGANTQNLLVYVDDARAHCDHARRKGATIVEEPATHDYGDDYWADIGYQAEDCGGHHWWFYERLKTKGQHH